MDAQVLKDRLVARALEEGFVAARICRPDAVPDLPDRLRAFLEAGYHGQMGWMAERVAWRADPGALWPEARSIVMLAESYAPEADPLPLLERRSEGVVSAYARGRDYHDIVKKRLKRVGRWFIEIAGPETEIKVFVDTAPVSEKALKAPGLLTAVIATVKVSSPSMSLSSITSKAKFRCRVPAGTVTVCTVPRKSWLLVALPLLG